MSSENDRRQGNAFTVEFLERMDEVGEPDGAHEADVAGPWAVRPVLYRGGTGFAVLREWESLERVERPQRPEPSGLPGRPEVREVPELPELRELRELREMTEGAGGAGTGDVPYAVFRRREIALLTAAVLPATGRELLFRLDTEPDAEGFPVIAAVTRSGAAPAASSAKASAKTGATPASGTAGAGSTPAAAGHLRDFDEGLAFALHLVAALVRSPVALAWLLEAAGHVALEQAGRILDQRVR